MSTPHDMRVMFWHETRHLPPTAHRSTPLPGRTGPNTVAIELAHRDARNESVPIMVHAVDAGVEIDDPGRFRVVHAIEQQQLNRSTVFGKHAVNWRRRG